jgi:hypothetical protein
MDDYLQVVLYSACILLMKWNTYVYCIIHCVEIRTVIREMEEGLLVERQEDIVCAQICDKKSRGF